MGKEVNKASRDEIPINLTKVTFSQIGFPFIYYDNEVWKHQREIM